MSVWIITRSCCRDDRSNTPLHADWKMLYWVPVLVFILETYQDSDEGLMEVLVSHLFVMPWGMMFRKVVRHVCSSLSPKELELFLLYTVFDPVEAHVKGFA